MQKMFSHFYGKISLVDRVVIFCSMNTSFICALFIPMFKDFGFTAKQISFLLLAKKFSRILSDIPAGILIDKFGHTLMFISARIFKIISFICCLYGYNFIFFFIAMIFDGLSYSCIYGKVNVYLYNKLANEKKIDLYQSSIAAYYLVVDIFVFSIHFCAKYLLEYNDYYFVIKISLIYSILSFILLFNYRSKNNISLSSKSYKKDASFKKIIIDTLLIYKKDKKILYLTVIYGIGNYLAFQFGAIGSLLLIDMGISGGNLSILGGVAKLAMAGGALFMLIKKNTIEISRAIYVLATFSIFVIPVSLIYNPVLLCLWMYFFIFFYILIEVSIEKTIDIKVNKNVRNTTNSIGWFISSFVSVISIAILGYFAEIFSYQKVFVGISSFWTIIILLSSYLYLKKENNLIFRKKMI